MNRARRPVTAVVRAQTESEGRLTIGRRLPPGSRSVLFSGRSKGRRSDMGHLELTVMETLWERGTGNVHDVVRWLDRPLAYNTVMTTLDRLFKKGLLNRSKQERAYFYAPRQSRIEWQQKQVEHLVSKFLSGPGPAGELLVSSLVDVVGEYDAALLNNIEEKIRMKRRELDRGRQQ
jgi:predicted transcriptional regulator